MFRRSLGNDLAAPRASLRPKIDDPIGRLDYIQIVLDDQQSISGGAELEEDFEQLRHVVKVQTGGRLIEDIECPPGGFAA